MFKYLLSTFALIFAFGAHAATTLSPGDIALITVNAESTFNAGDTCASENSFDFVTLVEIEAGTEIYFADEAWGGADWRTGSEGVVKYTAPSALEKGDIVRYEDCKITTEPAVWSMDGIPFGGSGTFDPSTSGDNILAFQGTTAAPSFITGIGWARGASWIAAGVPTTNDSYIPASLSVAGNTITDLATRDNYQYNCNQLDLDDAAAFLADVTNPANWNGDNTTPYPLSVCGFTYTPPAPPVVPTPKNTNPNPQASAKIGNTLRHSGQTRAQYGSLHYDGTTKQEFAAAYQKSLDAVKTWNQGAPAKIITYVNSAGETAFAGYRAGRIAVDRYFTQPYQLAWRGLRDYRSGDVQIANQDFLSSAPARDFVKKRQNKVHSLLKKDLRKIQSNTSYQKNRKPFRGSRKTDTQTAISSYQHRKSKQVLAPGSGQREEWKSAAPGWNPADPDTKRAPMKELYQRETLNPDTPELPAYLAPEKNLKNLRNPHQNKFQKALKLAF